MGSYAMVAVWKMDPAKAEQQRAGLNERIIPLVRSQPGLVQGRWTLTGDGERSVVYLEFDTEANARRFADLVASPDQGEQRDAAGVSNESIDVLEVIGSV